ncbi:RUN and FYVE domain-containing protein 2-like isoform X2 [Planococcus citri]|uniref:RUN and FYVE domain-containing protein 2-like isoform X2 n=1 Tax=Planococcus citri TaxID=170843 RepID=UPI0031F8D828
MEVSETPNLLINSSPSYEHGLKFTSRSPSISSIDHWPQFFVSRVSRKDNFSVLKSRDPVIIERRNLVNISKLIVKELIDTSMKYGRMLDSDHMTLQHFFIVLEHVLRHGLRPKKGLLGPKKELWDILQMVEKLDPEAQDMTCSVRDLPTVRTHRGRARAWLRVALMQKKLADYLKVLIDHRDDVLSEYFEPDALMMSEEAIVIIGLLVGLNVIDCNLCIKEEDLDCEQGVIDFSLYLRSNHQNNNVTDTPDSDVEYENMSAVLDQKNYIEELNRHLNATVANLQSQVESLTTTNALMKEDLEIAKGNIIALMQENTVLKTQKNQKQNFKHKKDSNSNSPNEKRKNEVFDGEEPSDIEQLKHQLSVERKLRHDTERELNAQTCIKAEMEVAMKLLEKDIHEKQDTIISLRKQLEDIKTINLEMYRKLQECENTLKHKTELIIKLEAKTSTMADALKKMDEKFDVLERERISTVEALTKEKEQLKINTHVAGCLDGELKKERGKRENLEKSLEEEKDKIEKIKEENAQLKIIANKYVVLQEEHHKLAEQCKEQEKALEELGAQFGISKLEVSDLKEEASLKMGKNEVQWALDKEVTHCTSCGKEFNLTRRKHHCRQCGSIFCHPCSDNFIALPSTTKPVRVCDNCHHVLVAQYSVVGDS